MKMTTKMIMLQNIEKMVMEQQQWMKMIPTSDRTMRI